MRFSPIIVAFLILACTIEARAQFGGGVGQIGMPGFGMGQGGTQNDTTGYSTSMKEPYTLKRYFESLAGKDSMDIARMWAGSLILPGSAQLYNKQYWKIPVLYGSAGALVWAGYNSNLKWLDSGDKEHKIARDLFYIGAALCHWGFVMDGVHNFKYHKRVLPARASLYSAMLPGLGQIYNGDYWKIPIFYGGFITVGYFISSNNSQYQRYKNLYYETSNPESELFGKYNAQTMKYYKDTYRRFRDYSILAGIVVYALNIIDANVFAHFQDFDVSDDLSVSLSPIFSPSSHSSLCSSFTPALGFNLKLTINSK